LKTFTILIGLFLCLFLFKGTALAVIEITEPYIQFYPDHLARGEELIIYGRNFCGSPDCSSITISINDHLITTDVSVNENGYFIWSYTVGVNPGFYLITVTQTNEDGVTLKDSGWLVVTVMDIFEKDKEYSEGEFILPSGPVFEGPSTGATEFQPNIKWGGRSVAVDVNPMNPAEAIAAVQAEAYLKPLITARHGRISIHFRRLYWQM